MTIMISDQRAEFCSPEKTKRDRLRFKEERKAHLRDHLEIAEVVCSKCV